MLLEIAAPIPWPAPLRNATPRAPGPVTALPGILLHLSKRYQGVKRARPRPNDTHPQPMFGEWLSLVEHLVRDQGVGGSNPLSPTILHFWPYLKIRSKGFLFAGPSKVGPHSTVAR